MITPRVSDIVGIINKFAPFAFAEEWDNVGLQVGNPAAPAGKIMVALDPCKGAVEAAVADKCQLLLTHHPLIFSPLKKITATDATGFLVSLALKNDLSVVSLHTNYDTADGGLNDLLAARLGLASCEPLRVTGAEELVKLSVFVPKGYEEVVLASLFSFSDVIGKYRDCSFQTTGVGTFTPLAGAEPFLGKVGSREFVEETRIEVLIRKANLSAAVNAMLAVHPYEEPAYDLYPLFNKGKQRGLGRICRLADATTLGALVVLIKERLALAGVRFVGDRDRQVKKVALCGGSGASLLKEACRQGADVFVTGDIKYHDAREAEALGLALVDAGHFATEILMVEGVAARVAHELGEKGYSAEVVAFKEEREPFVYA
jgi:dinuclear metal center YbgI/SA1388 family protein